MTTTAATTTSVLNSILGINEADYQWDLNPDKNTVILVKYLGRIVPQTLTVGATTSVLQVASINVPYMLGGKIVTKIGPGAYIPDSNYNNSEVMDRVVIHSDIISIEEGAFANCTNLRYLSFYDDSKLEIIKRDAFLNTKLSAPILPASLKVIEDGAFNTQMLKIVTFNSFNAPVFTAEAFNSQQDNGNFEKKITMIHYTNSIGYDNPLESKFLYVTNDKMVAPVATAAPPAPPASTPYVRYIVYFLLFVLFIVICVYVYVKHIKKDEYDLLNEESFV